MWDWFLLFLQIMLINIILSGDNAVVIALASKNLPVNEKKKAVWWGAFGAIGLRLILTIMAVALLNISYIQAIGSFLLLWIAIKLLIEDEEKETHIKSAPTLAKAIWTIILADLVMSLDNVLAIAAKAENDPGVIILGIALSVPIIIWGSTVVMNLLQRLPILVYLGAGILGYTAGEMFVNDKKVAQYLPSDRLIWAIPVFITILVIASGLIHKINKMGTRGI